MIRINQVKVPVVNNGDTEKLIAQHKDLLRKKAASLLRVPEKDIQKVEILRQSIDARKQPDIIYSYVIDIQVSGEEKLLKKIAKDKNICIEYLGAGDKISFESDLEIEMLAPFPDQSESDDTNELSLVCHVSYGDFSALITGDSTDQNNVN